jgi:two-component system, NarL family, response regulator DevR
MKTRIRLLIVDDHALVRLGLRTLLADEKDIEVIAEADSAEEALLQVANLQPDVVVLDIQLPRRSGLDACREIRTQFPNTQVVILTSHAGESFAGQALRAGAAGYVLKQVGNEELVRAVRAAHRGEIALDPRTSAGLVARLNTLQGQVESGAFSRLSSREMDVLAHISRGESNKEIGLALHLSEITVRNYLSNILEKLGLRNRIELATYAVQHHIEEHLDGLN